MLDTYTSSTYSPVVMLTVEQLSALKMAPLKGANKLAFAIALVGTTQEQMEAATGIRQAYISAIVNGRYSKLPIETARKFAGYFGCQIEDLFPAREAAAS